MIQFYFLSIVCNAAAGYLLVFHREDDAAALLSGGPDARLTLGILSVFTGFMKLLSATAGNMPVLGDILPAATGLLSGASLLLEWARQKGRLLSTGPGDAGDLLLKNRKAVGYLALASALLHFLFPQALLL